MNNIIIFDFEVFTKDTLLGAIVVGGKEKKYYQTWNLEEMKKFYSNRVDDIWIGHNNEYYDNLILQAVVKNQNPKKVSDDIVEKKKRGRLIIPLKYYDLMKFHMGSLKVMEAFTGKNISESEVDFDLDRPLTEEEKKQTEKYNRDDLDQTFEDFIFLLDEFSLRMDLINEFNLPAKYLCATQARVAAKVLGAEFHDELQSLPVYPKLYDQLKVENQEVIDFYMNRKYAEKGAGLKLDFGGTPHLMKAGGIHGAIENCFFKRVKYLDVSGY